MIVTTDGSAAAAIAGSSPAVSVNVVNAASADAEGAVPTEVGPGPGMTQTSPSVMAEATSAETMAAKASVRARIGLGVVSIVESLQGFAFRRSPDRVGLAVRRSLHSSLRRAACRAHYGQVASVSPWVAGPASPGRPAGSGTTKGSTTSIRPVRSTVASGTSIRDA